MRKILTALVAAMAIAAAAVATSGTAEAQGVAGMAAGTVDGVGVPARSSADLLPAP